SEAIVECIENGARVLNLSVALAQVSVRGERGLEQSLSYAARRGVIAVAAAGNQGVIGSSAVTRHFSVISVGGYDYQGRPISHSNLGVSAGRRGFGAPGDGVSSLGATGDLVTSGGTSAAAPFVTGAIALIWSEFPAASAAQVRLALTRAASPRR